MTRQAVILMDHGSSDAASHAQLEQLASIVAARVGMAVYPAHMGGPSPSLAAAVAAAEADGADDVIVAPCFLGSGRHVTETIPESITAVAREHPNVTIRLAASLRFDAALAEPIVTRIRPHIARQDRP